MPFIKHLSKDSVIKGIMKKHGRVEHKSKRKVYHDLVFSIMSQQLSTKVAEVFRKRFMNLYGNKFPSPQQLLDTPFETLRAIGLSNAKASYIQNIAQFANNSGLDQKKIAGKSEDELIDYLKQIKGVGQWTAEMILMFSLGRQDVFPVDDLGIRTAMIELYGIRIRDKKKLNARLHKIASAWSPYRTYACLYLWKWKDSK